MSETPIIQVDIQVACAHPHPTLKLLRQWVSGALTYAQSTDGDVCIRLVDADESARLNAHYRKRSGATNVLSFPAQLAPALGDIVLCAPLVISEAAELSRCAQHHWAHLCVHGALHLLGYTHDEDGEAEKMEGAEREILAQWGIADPYQRSD